MPSSPHFSCSVQYWFFFFACRLACCIMPTLSSYSMPFHRYSLYAPYLLICLHPTPCLHFVALFCKIKCPAYPIQNGVRCQIPCKQNVHPRFHAPKTRVTIIGVYTSTSTFYFENLLLNLLDHLDAPCPWLSPASAQCEAARPCLKCVLVLSYLILAASALMVAAGVANSSAINKFI